MDEPKRLIDGTSEHRKAFPIMRGVIDYFPDALAAIAQVSFVGNLKHNPGEPMHHSRGEKNAPHVDEIVRHLIQRGGFDSVVINGVTYQVRHTALAGWRSLALLQEELEAAHNLSLPRAAK